jgi:hypothetical protein
LVEPYFTYEHEKRLIDLYKEQQDKPNFAAITETLNKEFNSAS